jgi:hypothetical protein
MRNLSKGIIAGFAATALLSAFMVMKSMMGLMPQLEVIKMLSAMMGVPATAGWGIHFMIGTILWGGAFALFNSQIPGGTQVTKGIVFGLAAWVMMMVAVMPMAGQGLFGLNLGTMAPAMTAMLHAIFGAVMGAVYGQLTYPIARHA